MSTTSWTPTTPERRRTTKEHSHFRTPHSLIDDDLVNRATLDLCPGHFTRTPANPARERCATPACPNGRGTASAQRASRSSRAVSADDDADPDPALMGLAVRERGNFDRCRWRTSLRRPGT